MNYVIVGLGNPGEEYAHTRHNTGRMVLEQVRKKYDCSGWEADRKLKALVAEGLIRSESVRPTSGKAGRLGKIEKKVILVLPETFMNNSGKSVVLFVKSKKDAARLIVIYDDLDLPLGAMKISWNRGSGGHNGLESVIKALKTREFLRLRIGISPGTPSGKIKKPIGDKAVEAHILGKFREKEIDILKKVSKRAADAIAMLVADGREKAMSEFNK